MFASRPRQSVLTHTARGAHAAPGLCAIRRNVSAQLFSGHFEPPHARPIQIGERVVGGRPLPGPRRRLVALGPSKSRSDDRRKADSNADEYSCTADRFPQVADRAVCDQNRDRRPLHDWSRSRPCAPTKLHHGRSRRIEHRPTGRTVTRPVRSFRRFLPRLGAPPQAGPFFLTQGSAMRYSRSAAAHRGRTRRRASYGLGGATIRVEPDFNLPIGLPVAISGKMTMGKTEKRKNWFRRN
jgi:hypothetical protein